MKKTILWLAAAIAVAAVVGCEKDTPAALPVAPVPSETSQSEVLTSLAGTEWRHDEDHYDRVPAHGTHKYHFVFSHTLRFDTDSTGADNCVEEQTEDVAAFDTTWSFTYHFDTLTNHVDIHISGENWHELYDASTQTLISLHERGYVFYRVK